MRARGSIDLNADVGEGEETDAALVPLVSSVNIACGAHAGNERTMREALLLARAHGVLIGAHPGFEDRENFGRKERPITPADAASLVVGQTSRLQAVAADLGLTVGHIKLHGALYTMAARDVGLAEAIASAVAAHRASQGPSVVFALAGSALIAAGRRAGLQMVGEAFADRTYRSDGTLTPRSEAGALITDAEASALQALAIARDGFVLAKDGSRVALDAATLCLHGDSAQAVASARAIRTTLAAAGVAIRAAYGSTNT